MSIFELLLITFLGVLAFTSTHLYFITSKLRSKETHAVPIQERYITALSTMMLSELEHIVKRVGGAKAAPGAPITGAISPECAELNTVLTGWSTAHNLTLTAAALNQDQLTRLGVTKTWGVNTDEGFLAFIVIGRNTQGEKRFSYFIPASTAPAFAWSLITVAEHLTAFNKDVVGAMRNPAQAASV